MPQSYLGSVTAVSQIIEHLGQKEYWGNMLDVLPALMHRRLRPRGVAVMNVLPVPGRPWTQLLPHLAAPFAHARVLVLEAWENRVLVLGDELEPAATCSRMLARVLEAVGSDEAHAFAVRTVR